MSFFNEIGKTIGLDWIKLASGYNVINYNGEALYIEGIKKILKISNTEILVSTAKLIITVAGSELNVYDSNCESIIIKGKIKCVEESESEKK